MVFLVTTTIKSSASTGKPRNRVIIPMYVYLLMNITSNYNTKINMISAKWSILSNKIFLYFDPQKWFNQKLINRVRLIWFFFLDMVLFPCTSIMHQITLSSLMIGYASLCSITCAQMTAGKNSSQDINIMLLGDDMYIKLSQISFLVADTMQLQLSPQRELDLITSVAWQQETVVDTILLNSLRCSYVYRNTSTRMLASEPENFEDDKEAGGKQWTRNSTRILLSWAMAEAKNDNDDMEE